MSETDRRLKDQLNSNQAMRERMCLELLQTQADFTDIRPLLPKGGPDGGRDIEAIYKGSKRVLGAVGFVNDANDSEQHRGNAKSKFAEDLKTALTVLPDEYNRKPEVFVFFTNVGLTPGIIDELKKSAFATGITICEIYDRERMRLMLDCNTGYAIRNRYLDIPLSDAEQKDFFGKWGDQLQVMISDSLGGIETITHRLHFLMEAQFLVDRISAIVKLAAPLGEISGGDFLFQVMLMLRTHADGLIGLNFGSSNQPIVETIDEIEKSGKHFPKNSQKGFSYACLLPGSPQHERHKTMIDENNLDDDENWFAVGSSSGILEIEKHYIQARYGTEPFLDRFFPTCKLIDLHRCMVLFGCNTEIANNIEELVLSANQYRILHLQKHDFVVANEPYKRFRLPKELCCVDPPKAWCTLRPVEIASSFTPDFNVKTPTRSFAVDE